MPGCPICGNDIQGGMIRHVVAAHKPYEDGTLGATRVLQSPDGSSPVMVVAEAGTPAAAKPEPDGEWCHVVTETGEQGYVHDANVTFFEQLRSNPPAESSFGKAFIWTAAPIVVLGIFSTVGAAAPGLYFAWYAGALVGFAALVAGIIMLFVNRSVGAGIWAGLAVGVLVLFVTCFANLRTFQLY